MAETAVNDGVNWTQQDDGSIWQWDDQAGEWKAWRHGAPGPQPPKPWVKRLKRVEEQAARQATQEARQREEAERAFSASPRGRARAAKQAGATLFQISLPVSATEKSMFGGDTVMLGASTGTRTRDVMDTGPLDEIEAEGWRLQTAGYVFQPTGSQSRDRFVASGQVETIMGNIVGIYLFRALEVPTPA